MFSERVIRPAKPSWPASSASLRPSSPPPPAPRKPRSPKPGIGAANMSRTTVRPLLRANRFGDALYDGALRIRDKIQGKDTGVPGEGATGGDNTDTGLSPGEAGRSVGGLLGFFISMLLGAPWLF